MTLCLLCKAPKIGVCLLRKLMHHAKNRIMTLIADRVMTTQAKNRTVHYLRLVCVNYYYKFETTKQHHDRGKNS